MRKVIYLSLLVSAIFGGCSSSDSKKVEDSINETIDKYKGDQPREVIDNEAEVSLSEDMQNFIDEHNRARADVGVSNELRWSDNASKDAQIYADILASSGEFRHDPKNHKPQNGGGYENGIYGENLFAQVGKKPTYTDAAKSWIAEKEFYHYAKVSEDNSDCDEGEQCGHYTQAIWNNTTKVGCAMSKYKRGEFKDGYVIVCKYQTPGNYIGQYPYPR